ncbi:hypothetical protein BS47DRAFT_1337572 [Hydnum rufescens UP504]|uniref:Uncharacterized protein n=1 Tax=Hydnum rufescens UP504 TaxID=1448309 RepID=A0A9P6B7N8_9AGAM|nr:hypothetical protein BS47DRAFT_1337572 [Hydnum rufescens UP504]
MYNAQPSLDEAEARFVDPYPLLLLFARQYGVYLLHAHCNLAEEEKMVASGNINQPELAPNGSPFEYRREPVPTPPIELVTAFADIVGMNGPLGLFYAGDLKDGEVILERTEGRVNITTSVSAENQPLEGFVETGWLPDGTDNFVKMACVISCDALTTRSGNYHKGTRSHS